jgi:hypothetical protein
MYLAGAGLVNGTAHSHEDLSLGGNWARMSCPAGLNSPIQHPRGTTVAQVRLCAPPSWSSVHRSSTASSTPAESVPRVHVTMTRSPVVTELVLASIVDGCTAPAAAAAPAHDASSPPASNNFLVSMMARAAQAQLTQSVFSFRRRSAISISSLIAQLLHVLELS